MDKLLEEEKSNIGDSLRYSILEMIEEDISEGGSGIIYLNGRNGEKIRVDKKMIEDDLNGIKPPGVY